MAIQLDDFPAVQRAVKKIQQRAERAAGAAGQLLDQIKAEFGCRSAEEARTVLAEWKARRQKELVRSNKILVEFKRANADVLREHGITEE